MSQPHIEMNGGLIKEKDRVMVQVALPCFIFDENESKEFWGLMHLLTQIQAKYIVSSPSLVYVHNTTSLSSQSRALSAFWFFMMAILLHLTVLAHMTFLVAMVTHSLKSSVFFHIILLLYEFLHFQFFQGTFFHQICYHIFCCMHQKLFIYWRFPLFYFYFFYTHDSIFWIFNRLLRNHPRLPWENFWTCWEIHHIPLADY